MDSPRPPRPQPAPPPAGDRPTPHGLRQLLAVYDLRRDRLYGQVRRHQRRGEFLTFCPSVPSLYPSGIGIAIVLDNARRHPTTKRDRRVGQWAAANKVELASTPTNASSPNRIKGHLAGLRSFTLDGTDHTAHAEQATMIRRDLIWRDQNAHDQRLQETINRANAA